MTWTNTIQPPTKPGPHLVYCGMQDRRPIYLVATWDSLNGVWRCDDGGLIATAVVWADITPPEFKPS